MTHLRRALSGLLPALFFAASAAPAHAQCDPPGLDVSPATYPYGPVDPDDGDLDHIETHYGTELTYRFSLDGLSHDDSLPVAANYLKLLFVGPQLLGGPLPLDVCADYWLLPGTETFVTIPNTLEITNTLNPALAPPDIELYFQVASFDLGTLDFEMSDPALVRYSRAPWQGDPGTTISNGCYYFGTYVWNAGDGVGSVRGRIDWPGPCGPGTEPPGVHPLVVINHGDGHNYLDYRHLSSHLARNGFIVASIEYATGLDNVERAERMRTFIGFIRNHWTHKEHVENNIALFGHSRGGEAVLTAARKLQNDWGTTHDINAIIALAPTDGDDEGVEGPEDLSGNDSEALFVLYGSRDEDVYGYCISGTAPGCGAFPSGPQETGFSIYDRAGGEGSTEFFLSGPSVVTKSMLFVDGADHNRWRDWPCDDGGPFGIGMSCETHHAILKSYVTAFVRWRLKGEDDLEPYFTGAWTPASVAAEDLVLSTQFSRGSGRRVIDNFESGAWNQGTLATLSNDLQVVVVEKGPLYAHGNFTSPHDTDGMVLRWSTIPLLIDPWIRWTIDEGSTIFGGAHRDLSGFTTLSLRVGQMDAAPNNDVGEPQNLFVRLRDEGGAVSPNVWVNAFTNLSYPDQAMVVTPFSQSAVTHKSSLRTARIPLSFFTGVDLSEVEAIDLVFGDNAHTSGEVLIDNLEVGY